MAGLVLAGLVCVCVSESFPPERTWLTRLRARLLLFSLVGLLALAAPLVAYAGNGGPTGG